jgi:23S rRNA (uridine2552-2'-O)-methyltransferase
MCAYERKDAAYRRAKREGLRSRAAFKLEELDVRFHLFSPGKRVVDLGCWPGGWLEIAARAVGPRGRVVGVDLVHTDVSKLANVTALEGDVSDPRVLERVREALGGDADVVLSDMAPKLSGVRVADLERHRALAELAIGFALAVLRPNGILVVKLFSGCEREVFERLRGSFARVVRVRPETTRKGSSELYAVAFEPRAGAVGAEE